MLVSLRLAAPCRRVPVNSNVSPHAGALLLAVAVLIAVLLAFWAYVRWDDKRLRNAPVAPISRAKMEVGYKPGGIAKWPVYLAVAFFAALLAFLEIQAPSRPPFTGRWSAVKAAIFEVLGGTGLLAAYIAVATAFASVALASYLGNRR